MKKKRQQWEAGVEEEELDNKDESLPSVSQTIVWRMTQVVSEFVFSNIIV